MDQCGEFDGVEDLFHGIAHRQNKAGRELAQFAPGVHQGRGIGQEFKAGHHIIEGVGKPLYIGFFVEGFVRCGNRIGHATEHVGRGLKGLALSIASKVAFFQNSEGVFGKARNGFF